LCPSSSKDHMIMSPLFSLFTRRKRSAASRRVRRSQSLSHESLDARKMLAVASFPNANGIVLVSDQHDDLFFQQVASVPQSILFANNSSFIDGGPGTFGSIAIPASGSPSILITNGSEINVGDIRHNNWPLRSEGNPNSADFITTFPVSGGAIDNENEPQLISGQVTYSGSAWSFSGAGAGLTLVGGGNQPIIHPISLSFVDGNGGKAYVAVRWSANPILVPSITGVPGLEITYDADPRGPTPIFDSKGNQIGINPNIDRRQDIGRTVSAGPTALFTLPVTPASPGGLIPGTLTGTIAIGSREVAFTTADSGSTDATTSDLAFAGNATAQFQTVDGDTRSVAGSVDLRTGVITLEFSSDIPGGVSLKESRYAVFNRDELPNKVVLAPGLDLRARLNVDLLTRGSEVLVNSPLISPPLLTLRSSAITFNAVTVCSNRLTIGPSLVTHQPYVATASADAAVDGLSGMVTAIAVRPGKAGQGYSSSILPTVRVVGGGGRGALAEAVCSNGVITAINIVNGGSGYTSIPSIEIDPPPTPEQAPAAPTAEKVNFNAPISADVFDLQIGTGRATPNSERASVFVSSSGSLSGVVSATSAQAIQPSQSLLLLVENGDVVLEGAINCNLQSIFMRSTADHAHLAPFYLTTRSPLTGAQTGLLQGQTVAVTLGNDVVTPVDGGTVTNVVDLDTKVASVRVTAATAAGKPLSGPFPYKLALRSAGSVAVDAVAASGYPISLQSSVDIALNAAIVTAAGIEIAAVGKFTVSAPLTTSRGAVVITASNVTVNNAIRVLDAATDRGNDDIVLTATSGDLNIVGAIGAVNNVRLVQRNTGAVQGRIYGPSRITANGLAVEADGSADIRTDVVTLSGRVTGDFNLNEKDDISIPSLRSLGFVSLLAGGFDPGPSSPLTPNTIALRATLQDVTRVYAAAPQGSVDVATDTAKTLLLGDPAAIGSGVATPMQAAGSVSVRSIAGKVVAADAPIGGSTGIPVRVASLSPLAATYDPRQPGIYAATLTGIQNEAIVVDGIKLQVGDRVLVCGQPVGREFENGVYSVTVAGSAGRPFVLTRSLDADTTVEIPDGAFVRVSEGQLASQVFQVGYSATFGTSPSTVSLVQNRADASRVRVATAASLTATYDAAQGTITGAGSLPAIDGITLVVGDRVFVRNGTTTRIAGGGSSATLPSSSANGIYRVDSVGGGAWTLTRDPDIDTGLPFVGGYVVTTEGSYRASITGQAFLLTYDSLGNDAMTLTPAGSGGIPATFVGTNAPNAPVTLVVSSTGTTNNAAGSLGKMLLLRQANSQTAAFAFASVLPGLNGAPAGVIRLSQELPVVSEAFAIDGRQRYSLPGAIGPSVAKIVIDGSRITTTRNARPASTASEVNGIEFVDGSQSTTGTAGGSVSNLSIGGFGSGAAVKINGVGGILIDSVTLGRSEIGDRLANKYGVMVTGHQAEGTISGSTIVGSAVAGVRTEALAAGVKIVGTTLGVVNQGNAVGIELTAGFSGVGLNPVAIAPIRTVRNQLWFSLPAAISPQSLYLGQVVSGPGIAGGTTIAAINRSIVTLSKPMTATASTRGIRFIGPARNTVQFNRTGVVLSGGNNTVTNTSIGNNTYDGIRVEGGTQAIGTARKTSNVSNAIYGNGRYGVEVLGASQTIIGNNFGVQGRNQQANVVVNGITPPRHVPNARTKLDANGNFHAVATVAAAKKGTPWRPV